MLARRSTSRLAAGLAALALVLAACSSDDDDAAEDPTVEADGETADDAAGGDRAEPAGGDDPADDAGDVGGAGDEGAAGDVCGLVSLEDLETHLGSPFEEGEAVHDDTTSGDQCTWTNTDAPPVKVFSIVTYTSDGLEDAFGRSAEEFLELNRQSVTVDEELELGDEAFRSGGGIWARDGDTLFYVSSTGQSDDAIAGVTALAELAIEG